MNLAIHIANYAKGAHEDFDGEPDVSVDAVDLTTVHKAKGLEWPVVFLPSLTNRRFPSSKTGQARDWRREGLDVRAAYVHDLKAADRQAVDVSSQAVLASEETVESSVEDLRNRDFTPSQAPHADGVMSAACASGRSGHRPMTDTRQDRNLNGEGHASPSKTLSSPVPP